MYLTYASVLVVSVGVIPGCQGSWGSKLDMLRVIQGILDINQLNFFLDSIQIYDIQFFDNNVQCHQIFGQLSKNPQSVSALIELFHCVQRRIFVQINGKVVCCRIWHNLGALIPVVHLPIQKSSACFLNLWSTEMGARRFSGLLSVVKKRHLKPTSMTLTKMYKDEDLQKEWCKDNDMDSVKDKDRDNDRDRGKDKKHKRFIRVEIPDSHKE